MIFDMPLARKVESGMGLATSAVTKALVISLAVHLTVFGGWKLGEVFQWWKYIPLFRAMAYIQKLFRVEPKPEAPQQQEVSLVFVEVDPTKAAKEAPKDAKFYSVVSTEASNPEPQKNANLPQIEGKQEDFLKVTENEKAKPQPLQPTPPVKEPVQEKLETRPKEKQPIGDLALAKPQEKEQKDLGKSESVPRARPRTLAEVKGASPGLKSKVDGGVDRIDLATSLAARGTPIGDYDWKLVEAIRQRWDTLRGEVNVTRTGKIIVDFRLHFDGRITDMKVAESSAGEMQSLICQKAILDPAPFPRWPMEMRQEIKGSSREVRFTFYYYDSGE